MIQQVVEAIVNQMNANSDTFSFLHSEKDWQNLEGDEQLLPCVYLDMPVKYLPSIVNGGHFKHEFVAVALFLYKAELDATPAQQYATLMLAMNAQKNFHQLMYKELNNLLKSYSVGECYQVQNLFDCNMSGVIMPFKIEPANFDPACLT